MLSPKNQIAVGAALAGLGVVLGAFAAHGLDAFLIDTWGGVTRTVAGQEFAASWKYLQDFKTGAVYQMYHAIGLVGVGLLGLHGAKRSLNVAAWCFLAGIVFFSGSLYLLVVTKQTWLGAIAPIGGTLFIVGWVAFAIGAYSCTNPQPAE
jgi:uncharacterized membrane protein YgdD (TMEM256/DUF423 family)